MWKAASANDEQQRRKAGRAPYRALYFLLRYFRAEPFPACPRPRPRMRISRKIFCSFSFNETVTEQQNN